MKHTTLLLFFFCWMSIAFAQDEAYFEKLYDKYINYSIAQIDSLNLVFNKIPNDTPKLNMGFGIAGGYYHTGAPIEKEKKILLQTLNIAKKLKKQDYINHNYKLLFDAYSEASQEHQESIIFFKAAEHYYHEIKNKEQLALLYGAIHKYNIMLGRFDSAIYYLDKSNQISTTLKDTIALTYDQYYYAYLKLQMFDTSAIENIDKAILSANQINDIILHIDALNLKAIILLEVNDISTAELAAQKALKLLKEDNFENTHLTINSYTTLSYIELAKEKPDISLAKEYAQKAYDLDNYPANEVTQTAFHFRLGYYYEKTKQYHLAINTYLEAEKIAKKHHLIDDLQGYQNALSDCYKAIGQYDKAYYYLNEATILQDSIKAEEAKVQLKDLETKYETEKKELANKNLSALNASLSSRNQFALGLVGALGGILLLGSFLYYRIRQKNQTIGQQQVELLELNKTKDKFFATTAHDMRGFVSSLNGISPLYQKLEKRGDKEKINKIIHGIDKNAQHVNSLLDNLLNWVRLETNKIPYRPSTINVEELIEETAAYFENATLAKNITIKQEIPESLEIHADKTLIMTALHNLINNAIKFSEQGKEIIIKASANTKQIVLDIQDQGIGIPKTELPHLFEQSKQSKLGTKGERGTGLGLWICKELMKINKGDITVQSTVGQGSTFSLMIPRS